MYNSRCNRTSAFILAGVLLLSVLSMSAGNAAESLPALLSPAVNEFLSNLSVDLPVVEKLTDNLRGSGSSFFSVAVDGDGKDAGILYSLALTAIPHSDVPDFMGELEEAAKNRSLLLAQHRLALTWGQSKVNRNLYRHDEALGSALFTYYGPRGIETAADVLGDAESGRFAAALAWILPQTVQALEGEALPPNALDEDYCRFLYLDHARGLFRAGQYSEALPLFKNIHDLKWMDISAYLDAAECFLKMRKPAECLTLVKELRAALDRDMSSGELSRAGRLCREAGDRKAALSAFQQARVRFHEELAYHGK